ncbi:MAG: hypothetical protein P3W91_001085, partial [Fervidobacterium sp.]|nr:hypothetical protein [Fervidobacterium sp.]
NIYFIKSDGVEIVVIARSLEVPYETVRSWLRAAGELVYSYIFHYNTYQNSIRILQYNVNYIAK